MALINEFVWMKMNWNKFDGLKMLNVIGQKGGKKVLDVLL